jgi:hypothetical protein
MIVEGKNRSALEMIVISVTSVLVLVTVVILTTNSVVHVVERSHASTIEMVKEEHDAIVLAQLDNLYIQYNTITGVKGLLILAYRSEKESDNSIRIEKIIMECAISLTRIRKHMIYLYGKIDHGLVGDNIKMIVGDKSGDVR